jgi:hypothetical protein
MTDSEKATPMEALIKSMPGASAAKAGFICSTLRTA